MFPFPFSFIAPTASGLADIDNVYSMAFDGINDYVEISSGTLFDFGSNDFSFSGWFTRGNTTVGNYVLFFSRKSTFTPNWQIRQNVNNIQIEFNVGGAWSDVVTTTNPIAMDTNWHHLAITKSGTSASIYIDGISQATSGTAPGTIDAGDGTAFIGSRNGTTQEWLGNIDEVAIFDYELDSDQIDEIYNATSTGKTADLSSMATPPVAWYRMGD